MNTAIIIVLLLLICVSSSAAGGSMIMFGDGTECTPDSSVTGASTYYRDGMFGECVVNECATGYTKNDEGKCDAPAPTSSSAPAPEACNVTDFPNAASVSSSNSGCVIDTCATGFRLASSNVCIDSDTLIPGDVLNKGEFIKSENGEYQLIFQEDGNLVVYDGVKADNVPKWASDTRADDRKGNEFKVESNGIVIYDKDNNKVFDLAMSGGIKTAKLNNDGSLTITSIDGNDQSIINGNFDSPPA